MEKIDFFEAVNNSMKKHLLERERRMNTNTIIYVMDEDIKKFMFCKEPDYAHISVLEG